MTTTPEPSPRAATFSERDLVALLLVRAVEEHEPSFFSQETLSEAALAGVAAKDDAELLEKRTSYLFLRLPKAIRAWERVALFPERSLAVVALAAFAAGLAANYLGPSGLVHVAYNPLAFLVLWSVGVYALRLGRRVGARRDAEGAGASSGSGGSPGDRAAAPSASAHAATVAPGTGDRSKAARRRAGLLRYAFGDLWFAWNRRMAVLRSGATDLGDTAAVASSFWSAYWKAAEPVVLARVESLLHAGAIGVALGALAGTYLRGFFFEYAAVWRSTFVVDPGTVAAFLNVLLAPACLLFDGRLLGAADVAPLLSAEGALAAPWIHRWSLTAAIAVLVPRAFLALKSAHEARARAGAIRIDLDEPFYAEKVRLARQDQIHRVRDGVATALRVALAELAESVAVFVRDQLFDKTVAPELVHFRNNGGRVADLEAILAARGADFEPVLAEHLQRQREAFAEDVRTGVRGVVGRELSSQPSLIDALSPADVPVDGGAASAVATTVGDAIGGAATAAIAAGVATISGGVGKTLGIAIVSGLLHTSGPIGLLIGGVGAAAVVGGAYVLGRERMTAAVKRWRIPASVAAMALRDAKLEQARLDTYTRVKGDIEARVEPLIGETTEAILAELSMLVAARADAPSASGRAWDLTPRTRPSRDR